MVARSPALKVEVGKARDHCSWNGWVKSPRRHYCRQQAYKKVKIELSTDPSPQKYWSLQFPPGICRLARAVSRPPSVAAISHFHGLLGLDIDVGDLLGVEALLGLHQPELEVLHEFRGKPGPRLAGWPRPWPLSPLVPPERVDQLALCLGPGVDISWPPHCGLTHPGLAPLLLPGLHLPPLLVSLHQFVAAWPLPAPMMFPGGAAPALRLAPAVPVPVPVVAGRGQTHAADLALVIWPALASSGAAPAIRGIMSIRITGSISLVWSPDVIWWTWNLLSVARLRVGPGPMTCIHLWPAPRNRDHNKWVSYLKGTKWNMK